MATEIVPGQVLGLRPFTAKAEILPEQVIGRGLRLMTQIGPDKTQTLEVLGTRNLLKVVRDQLEAEGVGVSTTDKKDPPLPVIIQAILERSIYDIAIPITKPRLEHITFANWRTCALRIWKPFSIR